MNTISDIRDQPLDKTETDKLLDEAMAPQPVKAGAGALGLAALIVFVVGLQSALIGGYPPLTIIAWVMMVAAIGSIVLSLRFMKGTEWALTPVLIAAAVMALGSATFFVWSFAIGLFSFLALLAVGGAFAAAVMVGLAVGPFRKMLFARKRLRAHGVDLAFDF